jgi:low affinity Fe/Cu permease
MKKLRIFSKNLIRMLPSKLQNFYFVSLALFLFMMTFFGSNSFLNQLKMYKHSIALKEEKDRTLVQIKYYKEELVKLEKNKERIAREKYFMHEPLEDVFVFEEK